jgi:hypothetical protein
MAEHTSISDKGMNVTEEQLPPRVLDLHARLLQLRHSKPFRPFRILLKNGKRVAVRKPLWFAFRGNRLRVIPNGGVGLMFTFDEVDSIEVAKKRR